MRQCECYDAAVCTFCAAVIVVYLVRYAMSAVWSLVLTLVSVFHFIVFLDCCNCRFVWVSWFWWPLTANVFMFGLAWFFVWWQRERHQLIDDVEYLWLDCVHGAANTNCTRVVSSIDLIDGCDVCCGWVANLDCNCKYDNVIAMVLQAVRSVLLWLCRA